MLFINLNVLLFIYFNQLPHWFKEIDLFFFFFKLQQFKNVIKTKYINTGMFCSQFKAQERNEKVNCLNFFVLFSRINFVYLFVC